MSSVNSDYMNLQTKILYTLALKEDLTARIKEELSYSDFNTQNAKELAEFIESLLDVIDTHLKWHYHKETLQENNNGNEENLTHLENQVSEAATIVKKLMPLIKYVAGSRASMNHWATISILDRLCRTLYPEARAIVRPRWQYNYTYWSLKDDVLGIIESTNFSDAKISRAFEQNFRQSPHFFSLAYPPNSSHDVLMTAIWAHELAHLVDNIEAVYDTKVSPVQYLSTKLLQDFSPVPSEKTYDELIALMNLDDPKLSRKVRDRRLSKNVYEPIAAQVHIWARELFADIFSIHLFGPAALLAYSEFSNPQRTRLDISDDIFYPTERVRLTVMLQEYSRWGSNGDWLKWIPPKYRIAVENEIAHLQDLLSTNVDEVILFRSQKDQEASNQEFLNILYRVLYENISIFVEKLRPLVGKVMSRNPSCFITPDDFENLPSFLYDMDQELPPLFNIDEKSSNKLFALAVNTGWVAWTEKKYRSNFRGISEYDIRTRELKRINLLLRKALEVSEIRRWFESRRPYGKKAQYNNLNLEHSVEIEKNKNLQPIGGVLGKEELIQKVKSGLKIIPLLDVESQFGTCSLDVRLGNEFILTQTPLVPSMDPIEIEEQIVSSEFQQKISLPLGKPLVLHPGQFVLGSTLEYFSVPSDIMGLLIGRSSWGRLGFVISTPNKVQPGFKGCLTLQLSNLGNAPILLYPCSRIGQIVFYSMQSNIKVSR